MDGRKAEPTPGGSEILPAEFGMTREREILESQLKQILEATTDSVMILDREFRFTYANTNALRDVEPLTDVIGQVCWQAFPRMVYEGSPYLEHYVRAMEEKVPGEFEAFYGDPLNKWVRVQVRPTGDGIIVFFRNVTDEREKQAERTRLLEERLQFSTLVETSTDFIGIADMNAVPFYGNRAAFHLLGIKGLEAFRGGDIRILFFPEDQEFVMSEFLPKVLREGSGDLTIRFRHFVSGEPIWVHYRVFLLRDGRGAPLGYATVSHDLTAERQNADALIRTEKLAAVGRLAASIAHEINNPLESVTNLLYLARGSERTAEIHGYLDTAERELRRVSAIANQTLRFHKQATSPIPVSCADLIESVLSIYQGRIVNLGVKVEQRNRCVERIVCFDGEIRQVLSNLIGNAIDAMEQGGGRLLLRCRTCCEWSSMRPGVVMTVADNGGGISARTVMRIFDPFFTTKGFGGTGLGLWVSQEIVQRHAGKLKVRSRQGSGTVFALFLPLDAVVRR